MCVCVHLHTYSHMSVDFHTGVHHSDSELSFFNIMLWWRVQLWSTWTNGIILFGQSALHAARGRSREQKCPNGHLRVCLLRYAQWSSHAGQAWGLCSPNPFPSSQATDFTHFPPGKRRVSETQGEKKSSLVFANDLVTETARSKRSLVTWERGDNVTQRKQA